MSEGEAGVPDPSEQFVHPALFYRGVKEYLAGTLPFILEGLAEGDPVAVAVPGRNLELLRAELGEDAGRIRMMDMTQAGRNPGRIIPGVLRAFADRYPAPARPRIIGEPIWLGRTDTEYPACAQHEALINLAFEGRTVSILCPYDADRLDRRVLDDAERTHPVLVDAAGARPSGAYAPERVVERYNLPLPPPSDGVRLHFDADTLPWPRSVAAEHATRAGLSRTRVSDLELAISELATNAVLHGGGYGTLRVWNEDDQVVCEIRDRGHLTDPLVGRRPVAPASSGGRGILMVNHLADLVRVHTTAAGTAIRVYFALRAT